MWSTLRREGVVWSLLVATGSSVAYAYPYAGVQLREFESVGTVVDVRGTCPAVVFSVNGSTVATDTETDFDDLECSDILDGLRVEVEGVTQSDGRVLATEVESASESEDDEEDRDDDQDEDNETEHREAPPIEYGLAVLSILIVEVKRLRSNDAAQKNVPGLHSGLAGTLSRCGQNRRTA